MFNEMSMLVEQQDETIATIENHAQQVDTDMEAGLKHTEEAVVKARKARRKKWIWSVPRVLSKACRVIVCVLMFGLVVG